MAAVNSSSAPPTMNVSLAELAAPTPGNDKLPSRGAQWFNVLNDAEKTQMELALKEAWNPHVLGFFSHLLLRSPCP